MLVLIILVITAVFAAGCVDNSIKYIDGQFLGKSQPLPIDESDFGGFYAAIELYVRDGKVQTCVYNLCEADGTLVNQFTPNKYSPSNKVKLLKALEATNTYASNFVEHQGLGGWDRITDDPFAYDLFVQAVEDANKNAVQK